MFEDEHPIKSRNNLLNANASVCQSSYVCPHLNWKNKFTCSKVSISTQSIESTAENYFDFQLKLILITFLIEKKERNKLTR